MQRKPVRKSSTKKISPKDIEEEIYKQDVKLLKLVKADFGQMIRTGSTLLDLAISGGKVREGGIPGGILVEVFGESGMGKSTLIAEIIANVLASKGDVRLEDPEARFTGVFAHHFDIDLKDTQFSRPDTVAELFESIFSWKPESKGPIVVAIDGLASLSTERELEGEDKRGQLRAKQFHEGMRKYCRKFPKLGWLLLATNQEREDDRGRPSTPGGAAIPYYSTVRIRLKTPYPGPSKITRKGKSPGGKALEKTVGRIAEALVYKSTIDHPQRTAPLYIMFDYGIDDIRANLQWLKDMNKASGYVVNGKPFNSMDKAIHVVEKYGLEEKIRQEVIDTWHSIESQFTVKRKPKQRRA